IPSGCKDRRTAPRPPGHFLHSRVGKRADSKLACGRIALPPKGGKTLALLCCGPRPAERPLWAGRPIWRQAKMETMSAGDMILVALGVALIVAMALAAWAER